MNRATEASTVITRMWNDKTKELSAACMILSDIKVRFTKYNDESYESFRDEVAKLEREVNALAFVLDMLRKI